MDINTIIDKIVEANTKLADFWSRSHGWAPNYAADLMSASRLGVIRGTQHIIILTTARECFRYLICLEYQELLL